MGDGLLAEGASGHLTFPTGCHVSTWQQEHRPTTILTHQTSGKRSIQRGRQLERGRKQENEPDFLTFLPKAGFCPEWMEWWPNKSRIRPQLPESAYTTCKSGGYLPVSGGQLALVMAEVTTTNHCAVAQEAVKFWGGTKREQRMAVIEV